MDDRPIAVIDIGSNSGRIVVVTRDRPSHLRVLADVGAPLRLVRDLRDGNAFSEALIEHTINVLHTFQGVAIGEGVVEVIVLATSAMREAANGRELADRVQSELGWDVQIINGDEEARLGFLGAVNPLPIESGMCLDVGGGSLQIARFTDRRLQQVFTLPLGALRVSDRFLTTDPPSAAEMQALSRHVKSRLADSGVPRLTGKGQLIGTGGTVRTLAKIDRKPRPYPIPRLHGYLLRNQDIREVESLVSSSAFASRAKIPGLAADRADSIVGGAIVVRTVMDHVEAAELVVSGSGLREGRAMVEFGEVELAPVRAVRAAAIDALTSRFRSWDSDVAERRCAVTGALARECLDGAGQEASEMLSLAARALDIGRSVDFYNRHTHAATILLAADLAGFSHRSLALLAATIRLAGDESAGLKAYKQLIGPQDWETVPRLAAILDVADVTERHLVAGATPSLLCERNADHVALTAPVHDPDVLQAAAARFERVTGVPLRVHRTALEVSA